MVGALPHGAPDGGRWRISNRMRVVLALLILTLVSTLVTAVTYANFTASTSTGNSSFSTGTLSLSNDHSATAVLATNRLLPGDTVTGYVAVTNSGNEDVVSYQLTVALAGGATANNLTDSTKAGSLHMYVQRCTAAWVAGACPSGQTMTNVVGTPAAPVAVISTSSMLASGNAFCTTDATAVAQRAARAVTCDTSISGTTDYLKVVVNLPASADNTFQTLSTTLGFTFSGGQGGAANF